ncbi:glycosyltransferase family 1 protein [Laetiporus sulphureus 93-53]|uniref:sterol 3beta-glucosyltransferase n=1 Tax=Laetiporus sulphureus 93-53 TaxID=1314785 RepID=A0A165E662_9APHY|nr:glycosyltransferase family 1 protein [Laetiporus sulphureus 93-53]KZT06312.1 glycosyltransferase family 1 protein [Laetiporus sulphureus 93-53]
MHAGTQTLIQALQAMPWAEEQDEDDCATQGNTPADSSSDEDDRGSNRLASSIHTIYRPLARSRRNVLASLYSRARSPGLPKVPDQDETPRTEEPSMSEEELEDDFERGGPRDSPRTLSDEEHELDGSGSEGHRKEPSSPGSMATVKLQRRAKLAGKLREVFELSGIHEVIAEMPCWLLRSILLQGYMYLTDSYLCFFAHMPSREDQVLKSGSLMKKAQRTKRRIRHWFILKNDALSWYQSPSDPYFPHGIVDLRYAISCEPLHEKDIRLRTNQKAIRLSADSTPSRDEWVKAIKRVMFKAQNMGDIFKIAIPYSAILEVEKSSAMDFSETIEVKVVDKNDQGSIDSYFFAYFRDLPAALAQIRDAVRAYRAMPQAATPPAVIDTTTARPPNSPPSALRTQSLPVLGQTSKASSGSRLTSLLRPLQENAPLVRPAHSPERDDNEDFTHVAKRGSTNIMAITTSPKSSTYSDAGMSHSPESPPAPSSSSQLVASHHTYPPSPSPSPSMSELTATPTRDTSLIPWGVGMPSWLRMPSMPSRRTLSNPFGGARSGSEQPGPASGRSGGEGVSEVLSPNTGSGSRMTTSGSSDFGYFSVLDTPETILEQDTVDKFHTAFAFDEREKLLGVFSGYIYRMLPVYGRLYVSTNFFCFKSSGPLSSRTKMILPIRDVLSTENSKAFHFAHQGLVIVIRGYEELFFEFADEERRAAFVHILERQMEDVRRRVESGDQHCQSLGQHDALILEEAGPQTSPDGEMEQKVEHDASMSGSLPAVMFNSMSSTFLTFKPKEPLHFTFLTVGSRGDVQPYIALAKGLMKDGHRVRIATHGEFKEWIEAHGIEFGYVGGDPAELMRICVDNGTFTVSFLKEGMLKFRGWIDDLLKTSWEACQGTDVLIESPSAMAGYHIAEALKIPYFRAFTMTWSRTRAYPHAFAVPEHKMGGNYNYMSYVLFDQVFWRATAGQINRWRKNTLGLGSTSLDRMEPHKIPFLYNFSPVVVPPPLDWPEWIHVTGYWFLDDADVSSKKWTPPASLLEFIDSARKAKKKVVYIGFGSIVVSDPKAITHCVISAIVRSGVYAILSKGWSDRLIKNVAEASDPEEPLPKQIYPIASVPHDWLFKRVDAACHHGGAGTTGASLRAGIPTIIKPFFGDQFFWADRVEALGIGAAVRKLTVEHLTQALINATTDQRQIDRARTVGEQIRAEDGVGTAIEAIYRDMEYARSLIKGSPADDPQDVEVDAEHATIRDYPHAMSPTRSGGTRSGGSSASSAHGATSDWSVISEQERD